MLQAYIYKNNGKNPMQSGKFKKHQWIIRILDKSDKVISDQVWNTLNLKFSSFENARRYLEENNIKLYLLNTSNSDKNKEYIRTYSDNFLWNRVPR